MSSKKGWLLFRFARESKSSGSPAPSSSPSGHSKPSSPQGMSLVAHFGLPMGKDAPSGFLRFSRAENLAIGRHITDAVLQYHLGTHPNQEVFDHVVDLLLRAKGYDPEGMDCHAKARLVTIINDGIASQEGFARWYERAFELTL